MKKIISASAVLLIILSSIFIGGCNNTSEPAKSKVKKVTSSKTKTISAPGKYSSKDLSGYLNGFLKGKNKVYGAWTIKESKLLKYIFRNDGYAQLALGTEADFTKLAVDSDKKTLEVQFIRGMNGKYSYKLSKDNNTLYLSSGKDKFTLVREKDYTLLPKAQKNPKIDKSILGWWKSESSHIIFLGSDGVMYTNDITMETCYTYNISKGKIKAVYDYAGKTDIDYSYKLKNGSLIVDGEEYRRFNP